MYVAFKKQSVVHRALFLNSVVEKAMSGNCNHNTCIFLLDLYANASFENFDRCVKQMLPENLAYVHFTHTHTHTHPFYLFNQ